MSKLNVCYVCDERFEIPTTISLQSLLRNNEHIDIINTYIISNSINKFEKNRLINLSRKYRRNITFVSCENKFSHDVMDSLFKNENISGSYRRGIHTFGRIFLSSLLPDVDYTLYLDGDTLVVDKLDYLADLETDKPLLAAYDIIPSGYNRVIGKETNDPYFNAGVLYMNLNLWRKENYEEKILNFLEEQDVLYLFGDQDLINVFFSNNIGTLPLNYNMMYIVRKYSSDKLREFDFGKKKFYSNKDIELAKNDPKILHYTGEPFGKPWEYPILTRDNKLWIKEYKQSNCYGLVKFNPFKYGKTILKDIYRLITCNGNLAKKHYTEISFIIMKGIQEL